jgi:drug/metabolite transporter (DMT)-like permease
MQPMNEPSSTRQERKLFADIYEPLFRREPQDTQLLKNVLCWLFAFRSLSYILYTVNQFYPLPFLPGMRIAVPFSAFVVVVAGAAWWTTWKELPTARAWAIAASLINVYIFLQQFLFPQSVWHHRVGSLLAGVAGLVVFLRPDRPRQPRS